MIKALAYVTATTIAHFLTAIVAVGIVLLVGALFFH